MQTFKKSDELAATFAKDILVAALSNKEIIINANSGKNVVAMYNEIFNGISATLEEKSTDMPGSVSIS